MSGNSAPPSEAAARLRFRLKEVSTSEEPRVLDFLVLDDALTRLTGIKERYTQVVEMRFFGGLNIQEIAGVLGVSRATVEREWNFARLWLVRELGSISPSFRDTGTGMG